MRILVVEDDERLRGQIKSALQQAGFAVDVAADGVEGEYLGTEESYDVVVLDLGLPQRNGLEVLAHWREQGNKVPVVILTARDAWHERVDGLKAGADDYIGKPFHMEELLARLNAVSRRHHQQASNQLHSGDITLDLDHATVTQGERVHDLTATELRLLRYLMLHPGQVISKARLTAHVYEYDADKDSNVIEVYISRLRDKLGSDAIETRRGQGYVLPVRTP